MVISYRRYSKAATAKQTAEVLKGATCLHLGHDSKGTGPNNQHFKSSEGRFWRSEVNARKQLVKNWVWYESWDCDHISGFNHDSGSYVGL